MSKNDDHGAMTRIAGVEGGGTKFLAAVAEPRPDGPPHIVDRLRVDTADDPDETLDPIADWLGRFDLDALGIATFGPLDLRARRVATTPKPGWSGTNVADALVAALDPEPEVAFDTDVNGAVLAEWSWGAARGRSVALYLTVGTGIGGGAIVDGARLHGLRHPEMGHVTVPRHPDDRFETLCPVHESCLEGLASGAALEARLGHSAAQAADDDPVWDLAVHYLGHGLADMSLVMSPEIVVMGGGVMQQAGLVDRVADALDRTLAGYMPTPVVALPAFGQEAGLYGALALALGAGDEG